VRILSTSKTIDLGSECGHTYSEEQSVPPNVNWLDDCDVTDHNLVPQKIHNQCKDQNIQEEHNQIVKKLFGASGF